VTAATIWPDVTRRVNGRRDAVLPAGIIRHDRNPAFRTSGRRRE
jgi:hypothetical protein